MRWPREGDGHTCSNEKPGLSVPGSGKHPCQRKSPPFGRQEFQGQQAYRLRIEDYRVLYTIDDAEQMVTIFAIGHRRDVSC